MMKTKIKISLLATSLLVFGRITNVHAQNWLTAGNGLTGGTSSTPAEWLGSNNAYDFIIRTNNLPRMRVLSGGHVLMGSGTAATYPLTLNDYTNAGTLSSGGNFSVSFHSITGGVAIGGQDTGNNNAVFGTTGSSSAILFATFNGSSFDERARITSAGNVAIGTTSPSEKLSIIETVATTIAQISSAQSGGASKSYWGNYNDQLWMSAGGTYKNAWVGDNANRTIPYMVMTAGNADSYIAFATTASNNSQATERFRIIKDGKVGIGTTSPGYQLELSTNSAAKPLTNTWTISSDIRLKKDTSSFKDGLSVIKKIHPVNYKYNGKGGMIDTGIVGIGVIGQEIQSVAPYTVGTFMAKLNPTDSLKTQFLNFNSGPLLFVVINAIKQLDSTNTALAEKDSIKDAKIQELETKDSILNLKSQNQDSIIASLQNQMNQLASLISDCCNNNGNGNGHGNLSTSESGDYKSMPITNTTSVELKNRNTIVLDQNAPNPFKEQTTIEYYLPDNVQRAQIIFLEQSGKLIKTVDLTEKGKGVLNVFANDLTNGVYTYSLIVDGQTIETKKMIKQ